jgi:hypothetical protein
MDDFSAQQMRDYIMIADYYAETESPSPQKEVLVETETKLPANVCLIADLKETIFKLRAFTETESNDDLSFGTELGFQRAADMIENIINRYEQNNG